MAEADDLLRDALEANRARELLFRREAAAISTAAGLITNALGSGRTLYVLGPGELALVARAVAHAFVAGELGAPLRAIPLASEVTHGAAASPDHPVIREVRAFVDRGDAVLAFARDASPGPVTLALDAARGKGAQVIAVSGYPGEALISHADAIVVVPSRRSTVIAETCLAIGHSLSRLAARRLGLDAPEPRDPFESQKPSSPDEASDQKHSGSSDEIVVAELVTKSAAAGKRRHATSSVELVPLYVDDKTAGAPQPANTVRFSCGSCGEQITVDVRFAGRSGQCPQCLHDFVIPRPKGPGESSGRPEPAVPTIGASVGSSSAARRAPVANPAAALARHKPTPAPVAKPEDGPREERRRARRVSVRDALLCFAKGSFPDDENQPTVRHPLEDLSLTGLSFTVKDAAGVEPVKVGESLHVLLDFPAFVDRIKVLADVRRVEPLADRSGHAIGVRFARFLDDAQAKVRRLVENDALRGVRRR
jgi:phosphoheptose isomerase